jgi:Tfp pilus assembly protein PilV
MWGLWMRSKYRSLKPRSQRGDVLLEALISVLIMSIIGAGTAYITSRVALSAATVRVNGAAVTQMRVLLQQYGPTLCSGSANNSMAKVIMPANYSTQQLTVQCPTASAVTINGIAVTPPSNVVLCVPQNAGALFTNTVMVGSSGTAVTC